MAAIHSMDTSLGANPVAGPGGNSTTSRHESLFPEEKPTRKPPTTLRVSFGAWIWSLVAGNPKPLAIRCLDKGNPERAAEHFRRICEHQSDRRFDIEWLDYIAEVLGREGERAIVEFISARYGYELGRRLPDEERDAEERRDLVRETRRLRELAEVLARRTAALEDE